MEKAEIYKKLNILKPGDIFWDYDGYKCHVLVNLHQEQQIVFKYFGKHKKYWHYGIESYFWFELRMWTNEKGETRGGKKSMKFKLKKEKFKIQSR